MKATVYAIMSVDEGYFSRTDGLPDPMNARVTPQGCLILFVPLIRLQERGVKPGTKLKITIETVTNRKKKT